MATTRQPLAVAATKTATYVWTDGRVSTKPFAGYPSIGARDAAMEAWIAEEKAKNVESDRIMDKWGYDPTTNLPKSTGIFRNIF